MPQSQRSNDRCIINDINTYIKSTITLQRMNAYRLYLNVTFISEIVNTQGDITLSAVFERIKKIPHSTWDWSLQRRPNQCSWLLRKIIIRALYRAKDKSTKIHEQ